MGWYLRKSVKMGPVRLNFSKRGLGVSTGVKGFRIGTGPRGPYVAGGRGGIYFRQSLRGRSPRATHTRITRAPAPPQIVAATPPQPPQPPQMAQSPTYPPPSAVYTPPMQSPAYQQPVSAPPRSYGPPTPPPAYHAPPAPAPRTYHAYRLATLAGLSAAQVLAWIFMVADAATTTPDGASPLVALGTLATFLWLGSVIAIAAIDWHGFVSLRGRIPWWRLSGAARFWLVCAYVFVFEIMVAIYLVDAWMDFRRGQFADAQQRAFHIAQMEAELGMTPDTEGTCATCGKPLQAGAQFCSYCRMPVVSRPKVCPACATVALPDAQWCPKCGTALPS